MMLLNLDDDTQTTTPDDLEVEGFSGWRGTVKIPDALSCLPAAQRSFGGKNREHPIYGGPFAVPSPMTGRPKAVFRQAHVESRENTQSVTFHRVQSSFSGVSPKTCRGVSGLGPHEHTKRKEFEVDPKWVDFELQGVEVIFEDLERMGDGEDGADAWGENTAGRSGGESVPYESYLADWIAVDQSGIVHAGEIKASSSYYLDPGYAEKLTGAERALRALGITFHRDTGTELRSNARRLLNIDRAYGDASTTVTLEQADAIANVLARGGGPVPLGRIEDAIGGPRTAAAAVARAALCRRLLAYDLDHVIDRDTAVVSPPTPAVIVDIRAIDRRVRL